MAARATGQASKLPKVREAEDEVIAQQPITIPQMQGRPDNRYSKSYRLTIALLIAGWLIHVVWRFWLARPLYTPVVHGDEDRYLLFARALAGGPGGGGGDTEATRRVGYSLLITPVYWFASDPFVVYRVVQVFNILINALTFPLAYLFARRILGIDGRWAAGGAFVAASLPAVAFFAPLALPNAILTPLLFGWLLAVHAWLTNRTPKAQAWAAVIAGVLVGFMYVVHVRALLLLPIHAAIGLGFLMTRRTRWFAAAASAVSACILMALHPVLKAAIAGKVGTGGREPESRLISSFTTVDGLLRTISDATGQIWYLSVATWGLGAFGLVFAARVLINRAGIDPAKMIIVAISLVSTLLIAVVTAAALPDDGKINNHAFPGYIMFLAPVWAIIAIAALRDGWRRVLSLGAATMGLLLAAWFVVESNLRSRPANFFSPIDAPEPSFLADDWTRLHVTWVTLMTLLFASVLTVTGMVSQRLAFAMPLVLAATLMINIMALTHSNTMMATLAHAEYGTGPRLVRDAGLRVGDNVVSGVDYAPWVNHQREVYWTEVRRFDPRVQEQPPAEATIAIANFNTGWGNDWDGSRHGWLKVGADPVRGWAVWRRPSD